MRYRIALAGFIAASAVAAVGCSSDASRTDLKQPQFTGNQPNDVVKVDTPDEVTVFLNIDGHANFARVCVDGDAFLSVSTSHQSERMPALRRYPEWDAACPAGE